MGKYASGILSGNRRSKALIDFAKYGENYVNCVCPHRAVVSLRKRLATSYEA